MRFLLLFFVAVSCFAFYACEDTEHEVRITDVFPKMGTTGSQVLIVGRGFNSNLENNSVKFNGVEASILEVTSSHILVTVPNTTTGKIEVVSKGAMDETEYSFEYFEPSGSWSEKGNFPGVFRRGALCSSNDEYGFIGLGIDADGNHLKDFWKYNPTDDSWLSLPGFPGNASNVPTSFVMENIVYVFADSANGTSPELWKYEIDLETWTNLETPIWVDTSRTLIFASAPYQSSALIGLKNESYYSGYDYSWVEYNPSTNQWGDRINTSGYADPNGFYRPTVSSSAIYFGSYDSLWKFEMSTATWSAENISYLTSPNWFSFSTSNGNLYFVLGVFLDLTPNAWGYSPTTKNWFPVSPSPFLRGYYYSSHSSTPNSFVINDKLYIILGGDENGPTTKVVEFAP